MYNGLVDSGSVLTLKEVTQDIGCQHQLDGVTTTGYLSLESDGLYFYLNVNPILLISKYSGKKTAQKFITCVN